MQDSDGGEIFGVDGEDMYDAVWTHGHVGRRDLDVEEELLAARREERVGNGAAS